VMRLAIVVALGEKSPRSKRIINFAIQEAKLRGETIHFVHSIYGEGKTSEEEIIEGERLLDWAANFAEKAGVKYEKHLLVRGKNPADDVIDFADEIEASMIMIGVRKRSPAGKVLFGSVAQDIILHANKPVVCIK